MPTIELSAGDTAWVLISSALVLVMVPGLSFIYALLTTHAAAAAALTVWMLIDLARTGTSTAVGAATGAIAGLVAITPAAGYVTPRAALGGRCAARRVADRLGDPGEAGCGGRDRPVPGPHECATIGHALPCGIGHSFRSAAHCARDPAGVV